MKAAQPWRWWVTTALSRRWGHRRQGRDGRRSASRWAVLVLVVPLAGCSAPGERAGTGSESHPWHELLALLPEDLEGPLVLTDESAVRSAVEEAGQGGEGPRVEELGVPVPEHPFADAARLDPGIDVGAVIGFDLADVVASVTIEGSGTAYRLDHPPTRDDLTARGWDVSQDHDVLHADPARVDFPTERRPVIRSLSEPMLVDDELVLVGRELMATVPPHRDSSLALHGPLNAVLGEIAAEGAEVAVVVFDGYRPQRAFAPEGLERYAVGAVGLAGPLDARRLHVVLWHGDPRAAEVNAERLLEWLTWFAENSVGLDGPADVDSAGQLVHGSVPAADAHILMSLHRHRALPIGTDSALRDRP